MTDNVAVLEGFTKELMAYSDGVDLHIMVKPNEDLGERFRAWCCDEQEWLMINGWLFSFEEVKETSTPKGWGMAYTATA